MRRLATILLPLVPCAATSLANTDLAAPPRVVAIAPIDVALTFARLRTSEGLRVLAVTSYGGDSIAAVDLSTLLGRPVSDPIAVLQSEGWDALHARVIAAPDATRITTSAERLALPVDLRDHHIAAGTNYPEHAGEAKVEDGPFLFAKLVEPTASHASVSAGAGLLDYEVELAFVTLEPLAAGTVPKSMGLVVCNDYTDRATLLRHVDVWNPTSGAGFTTGKSFPGYLPIGNLFVVPRDVREFTRTLGLRLWVNDQLRQRDAVGSWIWDLDRLLGETWARTDVTWEHHGSRVSLVTPEKTIPAGTLLMAGTPAGTVFRGVSLATRIRGAVAWLLGGWGTPLTRLVVETYVREAQQAKTYLQPGDRVTIHVDRLGIINNPIVP